MAPKATAVDDRMHQYLLDNQQPEPAVLAALREETAGHPEGFMQITPDQGRFLAMLVRLIKAQSILEIGTFTGYSALAMALALPDGGRIVTCDINPDSTRTAVSSWVSAGMADRIELRLAPALLTLAELVRAGHRFDMVFIDADKTGYPAYYELALELVRPGGLIVLDNMLRRGRVADPEVKDPDTVALRGLNRDIALDNRVESVLLPIASGMTLVRRSLDPPSTGTPARH